MILYKSSFLLHLQGSFLPQIHLVSDPGTGLVCLPWWQPEDPPPILCFRKGQRNASCSSRKGPAVGRGGLDQDYSLPWEPALVVQLLPLTIALSPAWERPITSSGCWTGDPTPLPKSCWLQAPGAAPTTPDCSIMPFPPGPNPPNLGHGAAFKEENFQSVLVTDLCSNKILLRTLAHSTFQGGVENPRGFYVSHSARIPRAVYQLPLSLDNC